MATTEWNCDTDIHITRVDRECTPSKEIDISRNSSSRPASNATPTEPSHKRARLLHDPSAAIPVTNGFICAVDDNSIPNAPFHPDILQAFRSTFDSKFRTALKQSLCNYLTQLSSVEESIGLLKQEFKELTGRMDCIENSSKDLKKVLSERVALPAPTAGIGQRRTISSQAPRLPPPLMSPVPCTTASEQMTIKTPAPPAPPLPVTHCRATVTEVNPNTVTSGPVIPSTAVPLAVNIAALLNAVVSCGSNVTTQLPNSAFTLASSKVAPLSVRPMDMIDLTAESSPTTGALEEMNAHNAGKVTSSAFDLSGVARAVPTAPTAARTSTCSAPFAVSSSSSHTSKIAWFTAQNIPVTVARNHRIPVLQPSQLSFRELQQLPVAPLPPVPVQSSHPCPVQPMPQLTIAEAAEGVCLQWTVGYQSMFEAAMAYEIYSYASSELTADTIYTCLPWKKVGEVAALPLPMACTLTHVQSNNLYYFIVRSVDRFRRYSPWSNVVNAYVG